MMNGQTLPLLTVILEKRHLPLQVSIFLAADLIKWNPRLVASKELLACHFRDNLLFQTKTVTALTQPFLLRESIQFLTMAMTVSKSLTPTGFPENQNQG